jgi:hypothetical protein
LQENKREERKRMADDDAMRKIKQLEDQIGALQKQVASHKQVDATWKLNHTNQHQRQAVSVRKVDVVLPGRPAAAASSVAFPHSFSFPLDFLASLFIASHLVLFSQTASHSWLLHFAGRGCSAK